MKRRPEPGWLKPGRDRPNKGRRREHRKESIITIHNGKHPASESLLEIVEATLDDDKAQDVRTIALEGKSTIADYMVIATGTSQRQVSAMAEHLLEKLKAAGQKGVSVEGRSQGDWVLIDAGEVVLHLFRPEVRAFYNLEKMWGIDMPEAAGSPSVAAGI